jgi:serine/threonine-protein kinase
MFRSACKGDACIATASAGGPITDTAAWILDEVGGQWIAVGVTPGKCQNMDTEYWRTIRLKQGADGNLTGEYGSISDFGCANKRSMALTRTGDTDVTKLPDPATQPARVRSPAEGLRGLYHQKLAEVPSRGAPPEETDLNFRTDCLRTGDRCASVLIQPGTDGLRLLQFADNKWTQNIEFISSCPGVGDNRVLDSAEYPLPQPVQDPITFLGGNGHFELLSDSPCRGGDYTATFTRIGD